MNTHAVLLQGIAIAIQCVIVVLSTVSDSWSAAVTLSQLYLLAQSLAFVAIIMDNRRGGISYMIEFFLLFFIALPALLQVSKRIFPWFAMLQPLHICGAFGVLALSHIALHIGFLLHSPRSTLQTETPTAQVTMDNRTALFFTKWAWLIAFGAIFLAILAGPSNLFVARFNMGEADLGGLSQQFLYMCRSLSLLAMVMLLFLIKYVKNNNIKRQNIGAVVIFIPFFMVINYLPALPRFVLFGIFIAVSTIFINYFSPKIKSLAAVGSVLILFVVFPTIKSLGQGELDTEGFAQRTDTGSAADYLLRVDFDAFMQVSETVHYYSNDVGPLLYGDNFIGVALFFVPRAIWPDKPESTGILVAERLGYVYLNVSSPLPAEALIGFGLIGPILVFYLLAWWVAKTERYAKAGRGTMPNPSSFIIYALMMGFIVIIMRGALNAVAPQFATAFLVFFVMHFFKNKKIIFTSSVNMKKPIL